MNFQFKFIKILTVLTVLLLTSCFLETAVNRKAILKVNDVNAKMIITADNDLEGVYEFISETTELIKPTKVTYERSAPEWVGLWQFQKGYYTRVIMEKDKSNFFKSKKIEDLGFESFAGKCVIEGNMIRLEQDYALHPFAIDRSAKFGFRKEKENLILTQKLVPYMENLNEGTITILLRKVK